MNVLDDVFAYVGKKGCGCIVAAYVDDRAQEDKRDLGKFVAQVVTAGLVLERVQVYEVRASFGCVHAAMQRSFLREGGPEALGVSDALEDIAETVGRVEPVSDADVSREALEAARDFRDEVAKMEGVESVTLRSGERSVTLKGGADDGLGTTG